MFRTFVVFTILLITTVLPAQEIKPVGQEKIYITLQKEAEDAVIYLRKYVAAENQTSIKFFSTSAVPPELRDSVALQLSFVIHSMVGIGSSDEDAAGSYYPLVLAETDWVENKWDGKKVKYVQRVPGSETLFWIDIRDFNWSQQSWENITKFDGYAVEPIIDHKTNGALRLLSGNALVRADWFVYHSARAVEQTDINNKVNPIYRELLYSKTKQPKTVQEFRAAWTLPNIVASRKVGNEYGTLVTKSKNVARHNRMLFGYRTELGWLYQSYDVKHERGDRDFVEKFYEYGGRPPTTFDGGEIFATNQLKMQVYDLYNDKEQLVDAADATIVRHLTDVLGDTRVSVAHSCYDCHSGGPIPSENTVKEFLSSGIGAYYKGGKADELRVKRSFLSNKFEEAISDDQKVYERALKYVNGLSPDDNGRIYLKVINWYNKPVDLEQAAFECSVPVDEFKERMKAGLQDYNNKIHGRLAMLLTTGEPIPRSIWEAPATDGTPGVFQQAMIILNGLTEIRTEIVYSYVVAANCKIYRGGTTVLKEIIEGARVGRLIEENGTWTKVELETGEVGWIEAANLKKVQ